MTKLTRCNNRPYKTVEEIFQDRVKPAQHDFICDIAYVKPAQIGRGKMVTVNTLGIIKTIRDNRIQFLDVCDKRCITDYIKILKQWDEQSPLAYYAGIHNIPHEKFTVNVFVKELIHCFGTVIKYPIIPSINKFTIANWPTPLKEQQ